MKIQKSTKTLQAECEKETRRALRSMLYNNYTKQRAAELKQVQKKYNQLTNDITKNSQHVK